MPIRRIGLVSRTYRYVNRYRQIITTLVKYGFGDLIERLRINQYLELGLQMITGGAAAHVASHSSAERVRMLLEELGPTFIKLGQILSTRPDVIPHDFVAALEKLQHSVPPFPFAQVREIVESELRRPIADAFSRFDETALAAASIGQVHRAALPDGEEVVVKVQRPGIRRVIEVDLEILLHLAGLLERHVEGFGLHKPTRIVEEFGRLIERELDYTIESSHLNRFAEQFADDDTVYVPRTFRDLTTPRLLTMEYVEGTRLNDLPALDAAGHVRRRLAERGAQLVLRQVFEHGFFHADPHPGNLLALPGDVICLLDFGMMGRLDTRAREDFADLVAAVGQRDAPACTSALLRLTEHDEDVEPDERRLARDVAEMIDVHLVGELRRFNMSALLTHLLDTVGRHRLRIPPDLVTMLKAMATIERVAADLDPRLDMVAAAEPFVRRVIAARYSPRRVAGDLVESSVELIHLTREIPGTLRDLLRLTKRGQMKIGFEHRGLEEMLHTNERIANRVSFAIVVAALTIGSALLVHARLPPTWHDIPILGLAGFVAAGFTGAVLLRAIIRHGRM